MRRLISILFLLLLMVQAIPVGHFFSSHKASFYSLIDEEKSDNKADVEKKEGKEYLSFSEAPFVTATTIRRSFSPFLLSTYSSPSLDALTPPPNQ